MTTVMSEVRARAATAPATAAVGERELLAALSTPIAPVRVGAAYQAGMLAVAAVMVVLPLIYLAWSLKYGAIAGNNPWQATGLEWQIQSPPLTENFSEPVVVDHEAYDYEWLANKTQHEVTTVG